jgi:murein L,D-transpeptidase YcbB/YkuD
MLARTRHSSKLVVVLLLLIVAFVLLLARPAAQTNIPRAIESMLRDAAIVADLVGNPTFAIVHEKVEGDALIRFYRLRGSRLAWSGDGRTEGTTAAMRALSEAGDHGLDDQNYHLEQLAGIDPNSGAEAAATYDLLLTDAVLKHARHLSRGAADPNMIDADIDLPAEPFDFIGALNSALENGTLAEFLAQLAPPHPEYGRLLSALARYRKLAEEGGWRHVGTGADPRLLRERLSREDEQIGRDSNLDEALRRFQSRNDLVPDGKLGPKTLAALNVPAADRVAQIQANMERWRWLPRQLEARRVMVNAADATLQVIDDGRVLLESRVIVGTRENRTPIFRAEVSGITFNPPWNVPTSIARNEMLPRLRRDPNFLASQNIVLLNGPPGDPHGTRIDWKRVPADSFPYTLQQLPGPNNALGLLKLEMPNRFSVFLHDTPGRRDFLRPERNLSHGCIRVEEIAPLAAVAAGGDAAAVTESLAVPAATGETKYVTLRHPLAVYVLYWTAIANPDGTVQFRRDVYGRDTRLGQALRTASSAESRRFFTGNCESPVQPASRL